VTWASHCDHFDRFVVGAASAGLAMGAENMAAAVITKWRLVNMG